jgi:hypothetical protein
MLELTISKEGCAPIILGINGNIIKYKKENGQRLEINPFESERIAIYDKDYGKEISPKPKVDYYPIIIRQGKNGLDCPGKIIEIKEIL